MPLFGGSPNIEKLEAKGDVQGLIKALSYRKRYRVREGAARALGLISDMQAVGPLILALKDSIKYVRLAAAEALGQIADVRVVEPLIVALADDEYEVSGASSQALIEIGEPAVEPLIVALKDKELCLEAAVALGLIGDVRAVEPLIATLKGANSLVRKYIAEALEQIGWEVDDSGTEAAYWVAKGEWSKCIEIGAPAVEPLIDILLEWDADLHKEAARALEQIGPPAVEPLVNILSHDNLIIRRRAAHLLERIGSLQADVQAVIEDIKADEEKVLRMKFPKAWVDDLKKRALLISFTNSGFSYGSDCPYFESGVCMFRVISKQDVLFGPEKCSLQSGRYNTSCHVWRMDPR
jgi:HEAT repeat protein